MGYTQVLWLDGVELKYIEEVGSMNIFFVIDGEVVTPALRAASCPASPGIRSCGWGVCGALKMAERRVGVDELLKAGETGRLQEVFSSARPRWSRRSARSMAIGPYTVGNGQVEPLAKRFYTLADIQYGRTENPKGWMVPVVWMGRSVECGSRG